MARTLTVSEFARKFGFSEEYVRQMCRGYQDKKRNKAPYRLPEGWRAEQVGRDWIISPVPKQPELTAEAECLDLESLQKMIDDLYFMITHGSSRAKIQIQIDMRPDGCSLKASGSGFTSQARTDLPVLFSEELEDLKNMWRRQIDERAMRLASDGGLQKAKSLLTSSDFHSPRCLACGKELVSSTGTRPKAYCNSGCRKRHYIWIEDQARCSDQGVQDNRIQKKFEKIRRKLMESLGKKVRPL